MQRIARYRETWLKRCYSDLPDEVPPLLAKSMRAPSYKAIAIALLRNDHCMKSLGFVPDQSCYYKEIVSRRKQTEKPQENTLI